MWQSQIAGLNFSKEKIKAEWRAKDNLSDIVTNVVWPAALDRLESSMCLLFQAQKITCEKSLRQKWI